METHKLFMSLIPMLSNSHLFNVIIAASATEKHKKFNSKHSLFLAIYTFVASAKSFVTVSIRYYCNSNDIKEPTFVLIRYYYLI